MKPSVVDMSDPTWIALHGWGELAWHQIALELLVYAGFTATIVHAWRQWQVGQTEAGFRWLTVFIYGFIMELVSFNFIQNYAHAEFSVQLYHGQLPLYITAVYLVFHYTGIEIARRFDLSLWREAALAGLCIVLMDVPFDLVGPSAGWWIWADNTHTAPHPRLVEAVATRWYDVPVTSLYWYFLYGGLLSVYTRSLHGRWVEHPQRLLAVSPLVAMAVVVSGSLVMEPLFWLPRWIGVPDGIIVGSVLALASGGAVMARREAGLPTWLWAIPASLYTLHGGVLLYLSSTGEVSHLGARAAWLVGAAMLVGWLCRPAGGEVEAVGVTRAA